MATVSVSSPTPSHPSTPLAHHQNESVSRRNTLSKMKKFFSSNRSNIDTEQTTSASITPPKESYLAKEMDSRSSSNRYNNNNNNNNIITPITSSKQMFSPTSSIHSTSNIIPAQEYALSPNSSRLGGGGDIHSPPRLSNHPSNTHNTANQTNQTHGYNSSSTSTVTSTTSLEKLNTTKNEKKSTMTQSPNVSNSNISTMSATSTTTQSMASTSISNKRFVIFEDGSHEHHLKNAKRQEKLTTMLKNIMGSQKLRSEARSAVPDIIGDNNIASPIGQSSLKPPGNYPPTLISGLVKQMENDKVNGVNLPIESNQEKVFRHVNSSSKPSSTTNTVPKQKEPLCFAEKYGRCQEVLGKGAFGVVRICHKKSANKELLYAVKEFKKRNNESVEKYSKRLTSEFCISSSLHHPNIVSALDLFQDAKGDYCEVMEYCAGGDLFTLIIANGKLEYMEADCFFKQLIKGVVYMHDVGVAHRDLKPENLLLTSNGILKITDFGNSECFKMAWEKDIYLSGGICGSTPYIAPEEYTQEEFDPRPLDIWACGVIYMAMRTGRQLWTSAKKEDKFYLKYLKGRKEKNGYEPIELLKRARCRNVLYSILDPVPHRRITGKQILNSEWGREIKSCSDKLRK
ncbi:serine/threonine-protein kinase HAL4/Sat4p [Monosporozyma servazzii]